MCSLASSHKLALGTAQFGLSYGVANMSGKASSATVDEIIGTARAADITMLDTAISYGDSEAVLGQQNLTTFSIVSKLSEVPHDCLKIDAWVAKQVRASLKRLHISKLHSLLLHRPAQLLEPVGDKLYRSVLRLKEQGLVSQIGVSVYSPNELSQLIKRFDFDIVQAPMNIFDRRMEDTGMIHQLKKAGVGIHIRSAFLQGLLLMPNAKIPLYFAPWSPLLSTYHHWLTEQNLSPLQACLSYLNQQADIDKIIVGVDNAQQLQQIITAIGKPKVDIPSFLQSTDEGLLNPSRWLL
uniref:aldo/keto reductase n=1 Tax=uncultured Psychrobacter sp. TaxID=259303 RepID=UPI00262D3CE3|nr:aldo/keto reductase [uncultured Psychrobacter sp.]